MAIEPFTEPSARSCCQWGALGSDSERYIEGTLSNCGSDGDSTDDSDDDLDMVDARPEIEVMVGGTRRGLMGRKLDKGYVGRFFFLIYIRMSAG